MIQLQCFAYGTPKPEIIWVKKNSGRAVIGSNFVLESALPEDTGNWTCRASNVMGTDTADVEIIVASKCQAKEMLMTVSLICLSTTS